MKTRITLTLCLLLAVAVTAADKPNILFIISDDQAWSDYGFMGHKEIATPHLDRLAAEGLTFTRAYTPVPLCRPSLASMITGLYPHRHGVTGNDPLLPVRGVSPQLARHDPKYQRYYQTIVDNFAKQPNFVRDLTSRGYVALQTGKWWEGDPIKTAGFTHAMTTGSGKEDRHGGAGLEIGRQGLKPITDFIESSAGKPWLVWYAPMLPHGPHTAPAHLLEKYLKLAPSEPVARYWACVEWFDQTCGDLLQYLEQQKLRDNTIIVYACDNGWIQDPKQNEEHAPRSKLTPYEGGVRTPIMVSWPGKVKPRLDQEHLASTIDIWPTLAALLKTPTPAGLPGINLTSPDALAKRTAIFGEQYAHNIADVDHPTRSLQNRWIIAGDWKLIVPDPRNLRNAKPELYQLKDDPWERKNLADAEPERVKRLRSRLDEWWTPKPDAHTVALWLFDEPMYLNQALYDASSHWYNLNLQPRLIPDAADYRTDHHAPLGSGKFGNAIVRQKPGLAADTREELAFPSQSDWSWEFWLRTAKPPSDTAFVFDTTTGRERCSLAGGGASWRLISMNTGLDAVVSAGEGLYDNTWHHIAFVYRRDGTLTYFVDGKQRAQQTAVVSNPTVATAGRLAVLGGHDGSNPLWASLDELRISSVGRYAGDFVPRTHSRNFGPTPPVKAVATGPAPISPRGVVDLQGRKHLFIDGILLDTAGAGLFLRAHPPCPSTYEVCDFKRDLPHEKWDGSFRKQDDGVVIWNDGVFMDYDGKVRYYYTDERETHGYKDSYWSLAISDDGLKFTRPSLGLVEHQGSKDNNIVFNGRQGSVTLDANPGADPWARFKFTGWEFNSGTVVMSSPDGIHWTRNEVQQLPFDTGGTVEHFWDDQTGTYKCYLRGESWWGTPRNGGTGREALLAETSEFFKPWPFQPVPKPSFRDLRWRWLPTPSLELPKAFITELWPELGVEIHTYRTVSSKYRGAPDVYLSFFWGYQADPADNRNVGLATSRDGRTWTNWKLPWYIPANQTFGGVAMKESLSINGLVHREGELWQYAALKNAVHNRSSADDRLIRVRQRVDGFVSLSADAVAGEAVTREIRFSGRRLSLNARVRPGGSIRIALLNADGSERKGFGLEDCDPIEGDFLRKAVNWKGKADIANSANVRLKIRLQNADLYALQFADQVTELPNRIPHLNGLSRPLKPEQAARKTP